VSESQTQRLCVGIAHEYEDDGEVQPSLCSMHRFTRELYVDVFWFTDSCKTCIVYRFSGNLCTVLTFFSPELGVLDIQGRLLMDTAWDISAIVISSHAQKCSKKNLLHCHLLVHNSHPLISRGTDKYLAFTIFPIFLFATQTKEVFLDRLKKLEQRSHKFVELKGEYVE
jgi:hypothetical protein